VKVVITGATTPLGRAAVERLMRADWEVVAAVSSFDPENSEPMFAKGVRSLRIDLREEASVDVLAEVLDADTALLHLDDQRGEDTEHDRASLIHKNVLGTMRVLDAARRARRGVRLVIYSSTVEVYDPSLRSPAESAPTRPVTAYGATKLAGEDLLLAFGEEESTRVVSLRFADLYGPYADLTGPAGELLRRAREGLPATAARGAELHDLLHVDDASLALCLALARRTSSIVNVSDGAPHTLDEFARLLAGASAPDPVPPPSGNSGCHMIIDRARRELEFVPLVGLETGARDALSKLREQAP
jgi:nucleoside-diphosphate-sugar epimerase